MDKSLIENVIILLCTILLQVLVCNHIMLFNVAMAFVFIYIIIRLPMSDSTNKVLTWGFIAGLIVDIFSDTPGVNSLSCTILAMFKRPMLYAYIPRDDRTKNILPSLSTLGFSVYSKYLFTMSTIYCFVAFTIEYMNFADIKEIAIMTVSSSLFTFLMLLGLDSLIMTHRDKRN